MPDPNAKLAIAYTVRGFCRVLQFDGWCYVETRTTRGWRRLAGFAGPAQECKAIDFMEAWAGE
jgi:hypothetical protein